MSSIVTCTFFLAFAPTASEFVLSGNNSDFRRRLETATYDPKISEELLEEHFAETKNTLIFPKNRLLVIVSQGIRPNTRRIVPVYSKLVGDNLIIVYERKCFQSVGDFQYSNPFFIAQYDVDVKKVTIIERVSSFAVKPVKYGYLDPKVIVVERK